MPGYPDAVGADERPPPPVFCMECGPDTTLDADVGARVLRCSRCGGTQPLPARALFVVTGASGAGKSTIIEPLRRRLPDCEVFDSDLILRVAELGWDTWRNTWLQLAYAISLNGRATVLLGPLVPDQLERLPGRRLVGPVHFCHLDCPDDLLAERLRARPAWRGSSSEEFIARQHGFAAWLRANVHPTFDTGVPDAEAVADRVADWVRPLHAAAAVSG
jgi:hypothetical protein